RDRRLLGRGAAVVSTQTSISVLDRRCDAGPNSGPVPREPKRKGLTHAASAGDAAPVHAQRMAPWAQGRDRRGSGAALRPDQSDRVDDRPPRVAGAALLARARAGGGARTRGEKVRLRQGAHRAVDEAWAWWRAVTKAAAPYLGGLAGTESISTR